MSTFDILKQLWPNWTPNETETGLVRMYFGDNSKENLFQDACTKHRTKQLVKPDLDSLRDVYLLLVRLDKQNERENPDFTSEDAMLVIRALNRMNDRQRGFFKRHAGIHTDFYGNWSRLRRATPEQILELEDPLEIPTADGNVIWPLGLWFFYRLSQSIERLEPKDDIGEVIKWKLH